jgi:hypothetical protein
LIAIGVFTPRDQRLIAETVESRGLVGARPDDCRGGRREVRAVPRGEEDVRAERRRVLQEHGEVVVGVAQPLQHQVAVHELHRVKRPPVAHAAFVNGHDVRMLQARDRIDLALKSLPLPKRRIRALKQ